MQLAVSQIYSFPHRPPLRYFGGKWRLAKWILSYFPPHLNYCTLYGGGWCESFQKIRAGGVEVYNDLNSHNVNFMKQLQRHPTELIRVIEAIPRNREAFDKAKAPTSHPIEWAARYYIYCHLSVMGGGGPLQSGTSETRLKLPSVSDDSHLWAASHRLQKVNIEQLDAIQCISKYDSPETLFYCDPGYPKQSLASASREWYLHHTNKDGHIALAESVKRAKGYAVVSGYNCPLYQELFAGWKRYEHTATRMNRSKSTECLWIKPSCL